MSKDPQEFEYICFNCEGYFPKASEYSVEVIHGKMQCLECPPCANCEGSGYWQCPVESWVYERCEQCDHWDDGDLL